LAAKPWMLEPGGRRYSGWRSLILVVDSRAMLAASRRKLARSGGVLPMAAAIMGHVLGSRYRKHASQHLAGWRVAVAGTDQSPKRGALGKLAARRRSGLNSSTYGHLDCSHCGSRLDCRNSVLCIPITARAPHAGRRCQLPAASVRPSNILRGIL